MSRVTWRIVGKVGAYELRDENGVPIRTGTSPRQLADHALNSGADVRHDYDLRAAEREADR